MFRFGRVLCGVLAIAAVAGAQGCGPVELRVNNLPSPLGIDDASPRFSWQLRDNTCGARQTAYEVQVAASASALQHGKTLWDSGRIVSGVSINVRYAGPALAASTRYYWRVKTWDAAGKPYAPSAASWWETGLLRQDAWKADWIGYETPEEAAVRAAKAQWITIADAKPLAAGATQSSIYRTKVELAHDVRKATLYATCQDTVSAWVNDKQLLTARPLLPSGMMPWKKYVAADATAALTRGTNTLTVECVHYGETGWGVVTPMQATLYVAYQDGTNATFVSDTTWEGAPHTVKDGDKLTFLDVALKPVVKYGVAWGDDADATVGHPWIPDSVKALRNTFMVGKKVKSVRLYSTALGAYEIFLNGKRVGDDILAPGWTDYRERVEYQAYDVTALLTGGRNAIGALLAPGWYSTVLEWFGRPNNYGVTPPALRAQLRIEYEDGSVEWVKTDKNWQASESSIVHSEWYDGETQDARMERAGWNTAAFDASSWKPAQRIVPKAAKIEAQEIPPIRVEKAVAPVSVKEPKPGVFVYDFGQNLAGVEQVKLDGPAGTDVKLRFAEVVDNDGMIYIDNLRAAKATDNFILSGKGPQEFTPHFSTHGFRYMEITGVQAAPALSDVRALVVHTAAPFTSKFTSGSTMVNKLWSNILWSQRSNFISVPTDCPQRDERLGWMMDASVFWRTASTNMDLAAFSRKFAEDMRGTQATTPFYGVYSPGTATSDAASAAGWSDAGVLIPWTSWMQTGDTAVLAENWDAMERYLAAIQAKNSDWLWAKETGTPYGDWLAPDGGSDMTLLATAYWAYDVTRMAEMAHALGRTADEQKYRADFDKIKAAFIQKFVRADGFIAGAAKDNEAAQKKGGDTQTGYVLALHMNLLPDELRAAACAED